MCCLSIRERWRAESFATRKVLREMRKLDREWIGKSYLSRLKMSAARSGSRFDAFAEFFNRNYYPLPKSLFQLSVQTQIPPILANRGFFFFTSLYLVRYTYTYSHPVRFIINQPLQLHCGIVLNKPFRV